MRKIILSKEKETLLIPLFGKAKESKKERPLLVDNKAVEIITQIDYNFDSLKIPEKTNLMMCLRARLIDDYVRGFLARSDNCVALHLGCGLDSRYNRIENHQVIWYDVDFPDVIELRRQFYNETENYHLLSSSVTDSDWLENIPGDRENYIVIAEGLFMYLRENEIKTLIRGLKDKVNQFILVFDAFSVFASRKAKNHPSIRQTGAAIHWGIDSPKDLEGWEIGIRFLEQVHFTSNDVISQLNPGMRMAYKIADKFSFVKNAQRLLIYRVG